MDDQRIVTMLLKKRKTVNESKYKKYRNKLNKLIRIQKKSIILQNLNPTHAI